MIQFYKLLPTECFQQEINKHLDDSKYNGKKKVLKKLIGVQLGNAQYL